MTKAHVRHNIREFLALVGTFYWSSSAGQWRTVFCPLFLIAVFHPWRSNLRMKYFCDSTSSTDRDTWGEIRWKFKLTVKKSSGVSVHAKCEQHVYTKSQPLNFFTSFCANIRAQAIFLLRLIPQFLSPVPPFLELWSHTPTFTLFIQLLPLHSITWRHWRIQRQPYNTAFKFQRPT